MAASFQPVRRVDVGVRVRDALDLDAEVAGEGEDLIRLVAGIDADGFAGAAITDDPAVLLEHAHDNAADHDLVRYFHGFTLGERVGPVNEVMASSG